MGVRRFFLWGKQSDLDRVTLLEATVRGKLLVPGTRSSRLLLMQWIQNETGPPTAAKPEGKGVCVCARMLEGCV